MQKDISVIVPMYNRGDTVLRALHSLLRQETNLDFEIVVVDDGSTDDSLPIVRALQWPKLKIICQSNQGASAARLAGVLAADGRRVCFLDSDDVAEPCYLELLWNALENNKSVGLAFAKVSHLDSTEEVHYSSLSLNEDSVVSDSTLNLIKAGCFTASMNLMVERNIALDAMQGREHVLASNDYDFCLRVSLHTEFVFVDEVTIKIDRRPDGISHMIGHKQVAYSSIVVDEIASSSGRKDNEFTDSVRKRIESTLPSAIALTLKKRDIKLLLRLVPLVLRYRSMRLIKHTYWSLNHHFSVK